MPTANAHTPVWANDHEMGLLIKNHLQHNLTDSDRDALLSAARRFQFYCVGSSILGLGLGLLFAFRLRRSKMQRFTAFQSQQRPMHARFADGRTEAAPDLSPVSKPSTLGHIATFTLAGLGGFSVGGVTGVFTFTPSVRRAMSKDPERKERFETALRKIKADALRTQADALDKKQGVVSLRED